MKGFRRRLEPKRVLVASSKYGARTTVRIMLDMLRVKREINQLTQQAC